MYYPLFFAGAFAFVGSLLAVTFEYFSSRCITAVVLLCLIGYFVFTVAKKKKYAATVFVCIISFLLTVCYAVGYGINRYNYVCDFYNLKVTVSGTVTRASKSYTLNAETINGKKVPHKFNVLVSLYGDATLAEGDVITACGKLYGFDNAAYYGGFNSQRYYFSDNMYGKLVNPEINIVGNKKSVPMMAREVIKNNIEKNYSGDTAGILKALLMGEKGDMSPSLKQDLMKSGLSHIAVVSGMHISIILSVVGMCFSFVRKKRYVFLGIMFLAFAAVLGIVGGQPSVVRAVIMSAYCVVSTMFNKRYDSFTALMFSATAMIIYNPFVIGNTGYILSFLATFAIILGSKKKGRNLLYTTISIFILILPVSLFAFNNATLAMFFTTLLISPIITVLLPLGYIVQALPFLNFLQTDLVNLLMFVIKAFASIEIFNITTAVLSVTMIIAIYFAASAFFALTLFKKGRAAAVLLALSILFAVYDYYCPVVPDESVTVFSQQENNLMHIRTKNGKNIIITPKTEYTKYYLEDYNIKSVDMLVLTRVPEALDDTDAKKVFIPYDYEKPLKYTSSVRYYDDTSFGIDGVIITPVSYLPYKTKVDDKKVVLKITQNDATFLFEPYKDSKLNDKHLPSVNADTVILAANSDMFYGGKTVVANGLQNDEFVVDYCLSECGSVKFYKNKVKTLR